MTDIEPISSPTSDYKDFPGIRKRKRPARPDDAVYPGEERVEIEADQLENLHKMVEEIEGKLTVLKKMIKLVVSGVQTSCILLVLVLTRWCTAVGGRSACRSGNLSERCSGG
jgi:hypothetical protein